MYLKKNIILAFLKHTFSQEPKLKHFCIHIKRFSFDCYVRNAIKVARGSMKENSLFFNWNSNFKILYPKGKSNVVAHYFDGCLSSMLRFALTLQKKGTDKTNMWQISSSVSIHNRPPFGDGLLKLQQCYPPWCNLPWQTVDLCRIQTLPRNQAWMATLLCCLPLTITGPGPSLRSGCLSEQRHQLFSRSINRPTTLNPGISGMLICLHPALSHIH